MGCAIRPILAKKILGWKYFKSEIFSPTENGKQVWDIRKNKKGRRRLIGRRRHLVLVLLGKDDVFFGNLRAIRRGPMSVHEINNI
jgi:hypothetical protein